MATANGDEVNARGRTSEPDPSTLTTEQLDKEIAHLRELLTSEISGTKRELDARIAALDSIMGSEFVRLSTVIEAGADHAALALSASKEASSKAEAATEKRFIVADELRSQLADQARTLMPRQETEQRFISTVSRFDVLYSGHDIAINDLKSWRDRAEGKSGGLNAGWGYLVGGVAFLATLIGLAITVLAVVN